MKRLTYRQRRRQRGNLIINAIMFLAIISVMLAGTGTFVAQHYNSAYTDAAYEQALNLAEAGVNYEYNWISSDYNTPHAWSSNGATFPKGSKQNLGQGSFYVYCTSDQNAGLTDFNAVPTAEPVWNRPDNNLMIVSTGEIMVGRKFDGTPIYVRRTLRVSGKGYFDKWNAQFAVFGINQVDLGSNSYIEGSVGTNGTILKGSSVDITGDIYLYGPNATFSGTGETVHTDPKPLIWPTVDQIANTRFPQGGLAYLATHNDNASAGIVNNSITGPITLKGPGDYYVENVNLAGNDTITFDNTAGPVNLWVGPSGGTGTVNLKGTTQGVTNGTTSWQSHQINVFVGTKTEATLDMRGTSQVYANIYNYNVDSNNVGYGSVHLAGTPDIYGYVMDYNLDCNGIPGVHYLPGSTEPVTQFNNYGLSNIWTELFPR